MEFRIALYAATTIMLILGAHKEISIAEAGNASPWLLVYMWGILAFLYLLVREIHKDRSDDDA